MMRFIELPRVYPDQPLWGAHKGAFTFVITEDAPHGFSASVKVKGATAFDGTRTDLGGFCGHETLTAAKWACEQFYRQRHG